MLQDLLGFLTAWYNLPFTVSMAFGLLIAALQLFGLSHDGDSDMDSDADVDADVDANADADVDASLGHDLEAHADLEHDTDLEHDASLDGATDHAAGLLSGFSWLAFIGVGKTPLMVTLLILFFSVAMLGWLVNGIIQGIFGFFPTSMIIVSALVSLIAGSFVTSRATRFIGRALPPVSTTATRAQALVGMHGTVISPYVDHQYGMIHLRDAGSTLISLFAVSEDEKPIPRGETVILLEYYPAQKRYLVTRR